MQATSSAKNFDAVKDYLQQLQQKICQALELSDGKGVFYSDLWSHADGGGGVSCVLQQGQVFEQAGVNYSHVKGKALPAAATKKRPELEGCAFEATGVSLVIHPLNPFVPTCHMNCRFFCAEKKDGTMVWWFGGGYDLTPYYGFVEDCVHWHKTAKQACDVIDPDFYPRFKQWADEYFYLPHRQESRGVGGIFFDDLNELSFAQCFAFLCSVGDSFLAAYLPIVQRRQSMAYQDAHRAFQCYRRGRYVEFNLVYDRGTLFGLQSGGRTESILMSLPPVVNWRYNWQPEVGSDEAKLTQYFLKPCDWLSKGKIESVNLQEA